MRLYAVLLKMWLTALLTAVAPGVMPGEQDHPPGHPARHDYDPDSPEAKEWARIHIHPLGERDFPVDHPKALDTPGNTNAQQVVAGIDPAHPELEEFTGRTPKQAKAVRDMNARLAKKALDSILPPPVEAPAPPPPGSVEESEGQPDTPTPARGKKHHHGKRK